MFQLMDDRSDLQAPTFLDFGTGVSKKLVKVEGDKTNNLLKITNNERRLNLKTRRYKLYFKKKDLIKVIQ